MLKKIVSICLICMLAFPISVFVLSRGDKVGAEDIERAQDFLSVSENMTKPCTKEDGSKFVIGYIDIDPYPATGEILYYFIDQLRESGWITYEGELPFDAANTDAKELIHFLAQQDLGPYMCFSDEANYYTSEVYDGVDFVKKDLRKRVDAKEIDMLFCLGTQPADMVINEMGITEIPIIVSGSTDPVGAGLSDTDEYSGKANVWCHTNTDVYKNQMKYYYNSHPFTNIGMVYYDEVIASLQPYSEAAENIGFKITAKKIEREMTDDYYEKLAQTYEELVNEGIDAFLLNSDIIQDEKMIAPLLDVFYENNIPVFVQNNEYYVRYGATMVVTASDAKMQAPFLVDVVSKVLHGEEPGNLNQKFVEPPFLSLNLEAADRVGFEADADMLLSAEKLYMHTERN